MGVVIALVLSLTTVSGLAAAVPAQATFHEECLLDVNLCMDNWSQTGAIKSGAKGWPHTEFGWSPVRACNGQPVVLAISHGNTINCPFTHVNLDNTYAGDTIVAIQDNEDGLCVVPVGGGTAGEGTCPNLSNGSGGAQGVLQVRDQPSGVCSNVNEAEFINRYESDLQNQPIYLNAGPANGDADTFVNTSLLGCWVSQQS